MGWIAFVGMAVQAAGQIKGGQDAAKTAEYNATVAHQEAKFQKKRTEHELAFQKEEVERIIGKAKVTGAGAGTGLSQTIFKSILTEAAIDEELIRTQGSINIWRATGQSDLLSSQADAFRTAGFVQGGSTILGGLSKYDYRRKTEPITKPTVHVRGRGR